ncbi:phosphotransferase [Streptomyces qinzhouensis]|uniref:Phosphotransferase n=1 Tax=Streptomyces qinzhouensis TaxID=2599401 RepID=A0A5B8JG05_9ACTN|nr:phosphotransferase [Streptomyces qinzhouensis]QDY80547.1 phosphotransferase [Streptomyces qinzhouensis]
MQHRPDGIDDSGLRRALSAWNIEADILSYVPLGFGDHHWSAQDTGGARWFVTVSDLAEKYHCGIGVAAARDGLRRAMDTAAALGDAGLGPADGGFVVAPLRTARGETLRDLDERHAVTVFPWLEGAAGDFGDEPELGERAEILGLLATLHRTAPPAAARTLPPGLPARRRLERALRATGEPWHGGPRSEPARELLAEHAPAVRRSLDAFDRLAAAVRAGAPAPVLTHGEPHPGNLLRHGDRRLLLDWDTVGLAVPERDLWLVARDDADLALYTELTGRRPDPGALALYRMRWSLEDLDDFLVRFRSPHTATPDTEEAWRGLTGTLKGLGAPPS